MKKLTHCPHCQSPLKQKDIPEHLNPLKYEYCSTRCDVDYFQYFDKSYDEDVAYVSLYTPDKKFYMNWYVGDHYGYPAKLLHVYSKAEMQKYGKASPCLTLKDFELELDNLEKMQEKFGIYVLFS
jgi:endogenous inhibitor of DNA gyrase (YacG/DUF329 family)